MNRKPYGKTIRQELVDSAALKLRIWRRDGGTYTAGDAIEATCDGARPGTLGGLILAYVEGMNETAARRLEKEIERRAV